MVPGRGGDGPLLYPYGKGKLGWLGERGQKPRDGSVTFYTPTPAVCVRYTVGGSVEDFGIFLHNRGLAHPPRSIPALANSAVLPSRQSFPRNILAGFPLIDYLPPTEYSTFRCLRQKAP